MADAIKTKKFPNFKVSGKLNKDIADYDNDPFFLKKAEEAKELLKKAGLPKEANPTR